uniref:MYC binding protein n=1 Tax=Cyprinus carpio TaxID=7962 RepID=A0A8C1LUN8_CYPCA
MSNNCGHLHGSLSGRSQLGHHFSITAALTNPPISFIKHQLGVGPEAEDAESLRLELNTLQQKYDQLMEENKELRSRTTLKQDFNLDHGALI